MSDIEATDQQMATPHAYEDEFARRAAWMFDNVIRKLAREANSAEEFDEAIHWYGQWNMNRGRRDVAEAWALFAARYCADIFAGTA